eukprot:2709953-Rhodomonas_salina.1
MINQTLLTVPVARAAKQARAGTVVMGCGQARVKSEGRDGRSQWEDPGWVQDHTSVLEGGSQHLLGVPRPQPSSQEPPSSSSLLSGPVSALQVQAWARASGIASGRGRGPGVQVQVASPQVSSSSSPSLPHPQPAMLGIQTEHQKWRAEPGERGGERERG